MRLVYALCALALVGCSSPPPTSDPVLYVSAFLNTVKNQSGSWSQFIKAETRTHVQSKETDVRLLVGEYLKNCDFIDIVRDEFRPYIVYARGECRVPKLADVRVEGSAKLLEERVATFVVGKDGFSDIWLGKVSVPEQKIEVVPAPDQTGKQ